MDSNVIRAKQVAQKLGISVSTVWGKVNPKSRHHDVAFPKPFKVSANATGWLEAEISAYIAKLAAGRKQEGKA